MLVLQRFVEDYEAPTFGRLMFSSFSCYTVERPWLQNRPWVSCIPPGCYQLRRRMFNRGKPEPYETLEICEVPNRTHILLHIGNVSRHVQGCVALGRRLGCVGHEWAVLDSRPTFSAFWSAIENSQDEDIEQIDIRGPNVQDRRV